MNLKNKIISYYLKSQKKYILNIIKNNYISQLCEKSIDYFSYNGFPSKKDENWKYNDFLEKIINIDYNINNNIDYKNYENINKYLLSFNDLLLDTYRIVFIDGIFNINFSNIKDIDYIDNLSNIYKNKYYNNIIEKYYGNESLKYNDSFISINTFLTKDGTYINIPDNVLIKKPIYILYISTGNIYNKILLNTRNLIIVGKKSSVNIIEKYESINNNINLNISVNEIYADDDSNINYYKIQNSKFDSNIIDNTFISQNKNTNFSIHTFTSQEKFIRNNLNISQYGKKSNVYISGITIGKNKQIIDNKTSVNHFSPFCKSYEIYKGIYDNTSKGIFNGKILVSNNSNDIIAFQKNNNILLSKEASINSKPQLEIFSDKVKCSHGCTVGFLNKEILFYLMSRGISKKDSKYILLLSFIDEIMYKINIIEIKKYVYNIIKSELNIEDI